MSGLTRTVILKIYFLLVTDMAEGLPEDGEHAHKQLGHIKMPAQVHCDGEWNEGMINMDTAGHDFRWDPSMGVKPKKKRASKKEKGEKPEKVPSGKKRGRKPKTDKLGSAGRLADTGGAGVLSDGAALEWSGFARPSTIEVGANQVSVVEEGTASHARASLSKSPRETAANPAFPAFADEVGTFQLSI